MSLTIHFFDSQMCPGGPSFWGGTASCSYVLCLSVQRTEYKKDLGSSCYETSGKTICAQKRIRRSCSAGTIIFLKHRGEGQRVGQK